MNTLRGHEFATWGSFGERKDVETIVMANHKLFANLF